MFLTAFKNTITNLSELTPKTCVVFDLVPYTIWNVMSEKYTTIIDKIKELHQEEA